MSKTCEKCGNQFEPMPGKDWAKECFNCWKQGKNAQKPDNEAPKQVIVKDTTNMYVSYTKDLFIAILENSADKQNLKLDELWEHCCAMIVRARAILS